MPFEAGDISGSLIYGAKDLDLSKPVENLQATELARQKLLEKQKEDFDKKRIETAGVFAWGFLDKYGDKQVIARDEEGNIIKDNEGNPVLTTVNLFDSQDAAREYGMIRDNLLEIGIPDAALPPVYDAKIVPVILQHIAYKSLTPEQYISKQRITLGEQKEAGIGQRAIKGWELSQSRLDLSREEELRKKQEFREKLNQQKIEHTGKITIKQIEALTDLQEDIERKKSLIKSYQKLLENAKYLRDKIKLYPQGITDLISTVIPYTKDQEYKAKLNQVIAWENLKSAQENMRGQGSVTESERKLAANAASILSLKLNRQSFAEELDKIIKQASVAIVDAKINYKELNKQKKELESIPK